MSTMWLATRSTGLVSLLLLSAVMLFGVAYAGGWGGRRFPRLMTSGLHRRLSLLAVVFLVLHIGTTVLDGYAPVSFWDAFVPFGSDYKAFWIGLAAIAVDLLIAVIVTSALRSYIPERLWRGVHLSAYALWALAALHALGSGTDSLLSVAIVAGSGLMLLVLLVARAGSAQRSSSDRRAVPVQRTTSRAKVRA